ncbi:MAG: type IV pilus assembly protein PilM [Planctomycetales bacterium]|nr:type IV pilus assembly protein PilM [Planctomycetales bacterium]
MALNLLTHRQIEPIGLDIGTAAVKLVQLRRGECGYTVTAAAIEPVAGGSDEPKHQYRSYADAVKNCFQKAGLKSKNVVCGVAGPEVMVRGFKFGALPDEAILKAVGIEAQQVCPLDMKHSVLDYQLVESGPLGPGGVQPRHGLMAVSTEHLLRERTQILLEAGVKPLIVDVNALALLNCLNELELLETAGTAAVIDVGAAFTSVVIYGQDGLPFVRYINLAGRQIIQNVSQTLDISPTEAKQVLLQEQTSSESQNKMLLTLNDAIRPLAHAINETLRFYSFQEKEARLERIFLCGGFARMNAFAEFLADALPTPVTLLNPFEKMTCDADAADAAELIKSGPVYAVAAGLAMRTVS